MSTQPLAPPDANQVNELEIAQVKRMVEAHNSMEVMRYNVAFDQWVTDYIWKSDQGRNDFHPMPMPGMKAELYFINDDREAPGMRLTSQPVTSPRPVPQRQPVIRHIGFGSLFGQPANPQPTAPSQQPFTCPVCKGTGDREPGDAKCRPCKGEGIIWR